MGKEELRNPIDELCNQIKSKLIELGFTEYTLYACDYYGDLDEDEMPEDILNGDSCNLYWLHQDHYPDDSWITTVVRKIKIKDGILVFDLEEYDDCHDIEIVGYDVDLTIEDICERAEHEIVIDCLRNIFESIDHEELLELNNLSK